MTSIGRIGGDGNVPPVFTGPVFTVVPGRGRIEGAVPPVDPVRGGDGAADAPDAEAPPPITLAGRLASGDALPPAPALAIALEQATRALQGGRAHEVLAALDTIWSSQLAHDSPWYLRAAALELLARHDDAAGLLREAIAQLPSSPALLYLLGVHATIAGDDAAAHLATAHAHALHPDDPVLLVLRAAVLSRSGQAAEANALLAHAVALAPALPVRDWYAVLARLGRLPASHAADDAHAAHGARDVARLTPASMRLVTDGATDDRPLDEPSSWSAPLEPTPERPEIPFGLSDAVRYGLALLDAPGVAARAATRHRVSDDMREQAARTQLSTDAKAHRGGPGIIAIVVVLAGAIAIVRPDMRPAVFTVLAIALVWRMVSRALPRRTHPVIGRAAGSQSSLVDRVVD